MPDNMVQPENADAAADAAAQRDIDLEKEKWQLAKFKADTLVGIVKDAVLGAIFIGSAIISFFNSSAAKIDTATTTIPTTAMNLTRGGSGGVTHIVQSVHHVHSLVSYPFNIVLWVVMGLALGFIVGPRIQKLFIKKV